MAKKLEIYEEIRCPALEDYQVENQRVDIIVLNCRINGRGLILNPTIRWGTNNTTQDLAVNDQKSAST